MAAGPDGAWEARRPHRAHGGARPAGRIAFAREVAQILRLPGAVGPLRAGPPWRGARARFERFRRTPPKPRGKTGRSGGRALSYRRRRPTTPCSRWSSRSGHSVIRGRNRRPGAAWTPSTLTRNERQRNDGTSRRQGRAHLGRRQWPGAQPRTAMVSRAPGGDQRLLDETASPAKELGAVQVLHHDVTQKRWAAVCGATTRMWAPDSREHAGSHDHPLAMLAARTTEGDSVNQMGVFSGQARHAGDGFVRGGSIIHLAVAAYADRRRPLRTRRASGPCAGDQSAALDWLVRHPA